MQQSDDSDPSRGGDSADRRSAGAEGSGSDPGPDPLRPPPTRIKVRFYELDPYGHVNHGVYLNYFEVARIDLLEAVGFGLSRLQQLGYHLLVVESHVRFRAPAVAGDELTVHTQVSQLRRASATWEQQILRGAQTIAENTIRSAITDSRGRPTKAPEEVSRSLRRLQLPMNG